MERAGTVLAGKYALQSKLGQGGMGSVWRAEHVQLRSPVAIKLIDAQIVGNPEALARFMREAQSAAALRSPHVVQILDFGADQGVPYIAMELLEGESLAGRIESAGRLSPARTAQVVTDVTRAMSKAHEAGIVHRDLKPDNIFLVRNDEEEIAKVLDFGIAKAAHVLGTPTGSATRTGAILGTPYYMSPEQAEGNKHVDHRTDIWAIGVIAFECLLGRRPFESEALGSLLLAICTRPLPVPSSMGQVPPGFDAWFARACARELGERFQTARELAAELRRVCAERDSRDIAPQSHALTQRAITGASATPYSAAQPTANPYSTSVGLVPKRKPVAAIVLGAILLTAAVAVAAAFALQPGADPAGEAAAEASPAAATAPSPATVAVPTPTPRVEVAPAPPTLPAPAASTPAASSAPSVAATSRPPPARPARTPAAAARSKPARPSAPAPAPAPAPEPKPASKPAPSRVNLGI